MKKTNRIGDTSFSGTVVGSDGKAIQVFTVQVYNSDGELIDSQTFTSGTWTLDVIPGYGYAFSAYPVYSGIELDGSLISQGTIVAIPANSSTPATPASSNTLIYLLAGGAVLLLLSKKKEKKQVGKLETEDVMPYLLIGGAILVLTAGNKILQGLGIEDSADTMALNAQQTNPGSYWNPNFYEQFSSQSVPLDPIRAASDAQAILDAYGFFSTSFSSILGIFTNYQTQSQVSYLANAFSQANDGADLLTYLRSGLWPFALSDSQVQQINSYVSKLPTN